MDVTPQIFHARVMHKRLSPTINQFSYGVYYLCLPLESLASVELQEKLAVNRRGFTSFHSCDHGAKDGSGLIEWATEILKTHGLSEVVDQTILIAMPRIMGYVFNPVSFWLCLDADRGLRAVLCEVNNTFGETHHYLCTHPDGRLLEADDWLEADKSFHVSPFLERAGQYRFRFSLVGNRLGVWIDYINRDGNKQLLTALTGELVPLTRAALRHAFWRYPLVTAKAIMLIHWQAVRLLMRRVRYIVKPEPLPQTLSITRDVTKM